MKKFLVAVQYWDGDRDSALGLMELLAETVEEKNPWADFVVFYRFDATPPPPELFKKLERAFDKVFVCRGKEQLTGWPDGCNGMWYHLMETTFLLYAQTKVWKDYKSILTIESDTCPLSDDWLEVLSKEWDEHDVHVMGAWDSRNGDCPGLGHINGNGMFSMILPALARTPLLAPCGRGWDTHFAALFKKLGWQGTYAIRNFYRDKTLSPASFKKLLAEHAVLLHGIKDDSVRKLYLASR